MIKFKGPEYTQFMSFAHGVTFKVKPGEWEIEWWGFVFTDKDNKVVGVESATKQWLIVGHEEFAFFGPSNCGIRLQKVSPGCEIKHSERLALAVGSAWKHTKSFGRI